MKNSFLVSILIPTYNSQSTIERALISCLEQTIDADIEIIIIDDHSSDSTLRIAEQVLKRNQRIGTSFRIISKDQNQGPAASRNEGMRSASGKYIAFLDSDDYWASDKLKESIAFLESHPEADLIGHSYALASNPNLINNTQTRKISTLSLLIHNPMATPTIVLRSGKNIFFNERMRFAEDHDFLLRFSQKNSIFRTKIPSTAATFLGRPPLSTGGQSANKTKMRLGEMHMLINFCCGRPTYLPLLPFLLLLSLAKHLRQLLKRTTNAP